MRFIVWLLFAAAVVGGLGLAFSVEALGVGFFDQAVVVESTAQIRRVWYCCEPVDDATRQWAERTADLRLFVCDEATVTADNRFSARIKFTSRSGWLRKEQVHYPGQLVVNVESENGARACRVVDLPNGRGREAVVVRLP